MQPAESMMFRQSPDGLRYEEPRWPRRARLALVGFGAAFCVVPVPFLLHDAAAFAPAAIAGAALGLIFMAVGRAQPQQLHFDARQRRIVRRCGLRREVLAFDRVTAIDVLRHTGLDAPDWFQVALHFHGRRPLHLGIFDTRVAAAQWQQRLQALIG